jgi:hypothetical protein
MAMPVIDPPPSANELDVDPWSDNPAVLAAAFQFIE